MKNKSTLPKKNISYTAGLKDFMVSNYLLTTKYIFNTFFLQTYVNTTLYEKFAYAGIDCSAEEAA